VVLYKKRIQSKAKERLMLILRIGEDVQLRALIMEGLHTSSLQLRFGLGDS
jgi:hypothetical protein